MPTNANLIDTASGDGALGVFLRVVEGAGMTDTLAHEGPFTVFEPTNMAFQAANGSLARLVTRPEQARHLVHGHVIEGECT
jgi:uncharacterized surface protein with fasciclin (FAS1) repeats